MSDIEPDVCECGHLLAQHGITECQVRDCGCLRFRMWPGHEHGDRHATNNEVRDSAKRMLAKHRRSFERLSEWRDIETAPKDGTHIVAISNVIPNCRPTEIAYNIWEGCWADHPAPSDMCPVRRVSTEPTHWLPVPEWPEAPK